MIPRLDGFVTINGIVQYDDSYYVTYDDRLIFAEAPPTGSSINITYNYGTIQNLRGNGTQNVFPVEGNIEQAKFSRLMRDITKHKDNPAVKDLLEQLRVVTELLR